MTDYLVTKASQNCVIQLKGSTITLAQAVCSSVAFLGTLLLGLYYHYENIVKNEFYGYPDEWFPSVSATIGDWFPERSYFHYFIALTAVPRFVSLLLSFVYLSQSRTNKLLSYLLNFFGLLRTLLCGGWVFVSSTDDHDWHDILMISYLLCNIPWFLGYIAASSNKSSHAYRKLISTAFFASIIPLVYFFIQHKVHRVPGAYTSYAFFEWSLVIFDVAFDACAYWEFSHINIAISFQEREAFKSYNKESSDKLSISNTLANALHKATHGESQYVFDYMAHVLSSVVFWTNLTALGVLIWYFPLWNMGISGYEALLFCTQSPVFLCSQAVLSLCISNIHGLEFAPLIGIASRWVSSPSLRLITLSVGVAFSTIVWTIKLHSMQVYSQFMFGLVISMILKYLFHTNNPFWPVMNEATRGHNFLGLLIGMIYSTYFFLRKSKSSPITEYSNTIQSKTSKNPINLSAAFGAILFALHTLVSDSSNIIINVWDGYPIRGPLPNPHGIFTIVLMTQAILLGVYYSEFFLRPELNFLSWLSLGLYHFCSHWIGYVGGAAYAVYIIAITKPILASLTMRNCGITYTFAYLVYNMLTLASVWIVAYAFVPGGFALRERTWVLLLITQVLVTLGVYQSRSENTESKLRPYYNSSKFKRKPQENSINCKVLMTFAIFSSIFAIFSGFTRLSLDQFKPYHPNSKLLTAGIWTTHFSLDNEMWISDLRIRDAIRDMELDVVGLLETDTQRIIGGYRDLSQYLAESLNMYADYGPSPRKHTWGAALLSKFPILRSTHHLLPSPEGELAPAIHATLLVYGKEIDVIVSHNGQEETPIDRKLQSTTLGNIMKKSKNPLIFLGYVVSIPGEEPQSLLLKDNGMKDVEPTDWDRWCEYILYRGMKRIGYARLNKGSITDTEIQSAKFLVTEPEGQSERIPEDQVPEDCRYPTYFRGSGIRGHYYDNNEVVKEPWYYN